MPRPASPVRLPARHTPTGGSLGLAPATPCNLDSAFLDLLKSGASELHERGVIATSSPVNLNMREVRITCAQACAIREHGQALAAAYGQWDTAAVAGGYIGDVYRLITPLGNRPKRRFARHRSPGRLD